MPDYSEMQGWPRELYTLDGAAAERKLLTAWSDRFAVAVELDTPPNNIYPYDTAGAILDRIKITPHQNSKSADAGGGKISYDEAVLTVNYSTSGPVTANLVSERLTPGVYGSKWSHEGLYWNNDGTSPLLPNEGPQRLHPTMTYTLEYHRLGAVPSSVFTLGGYINSNTVFTKILGVYILPTFLRYDNAVVRRTQTAAGITTFKVTHVAQYVYNNGFGWNGVWNRFAGASGAYAPIFDADGNQRFPYPSAAFNL